MKNYNIKINGNSYNVVIDSVDDKGMAKVSVNGKEYRVEIDKPAQSATSAAPATAVTSVSSVKAAPVSSVAEKVIVTPLPGVIIAVNVNVGDSVKAGQSVAVLEAMKMENAIEAESDGIIKAIHVQKGNSVLEGAKIVTLG